MAVAQLARPSLILVYDFAVSPDEVKLDKGLSADIMQKYEEHKGMSRTAEEIKVGHKVADALAEELVKKIRSYGLMAERGFGYPRGNEKDLMIKGHLLASTVVSGALSGTSEMTSATVEADAKRLAEKIAADLGKFFVDQGWVPAEAVKKKSLL